MPIWLAAMGWLGARDVWPRFAALDAPPLQTSDWFSRHDTKVQFEITDGNVRLGTIWTTYLVDRRSIRRDDMVWIERFPLDIAPLRISVGSVFTGDGVLDEFGLMIESRGSGWPIILEGERFPNDFAFTLETGPQTHRSFKIPLHRGSLITGAFSPLSELRDLELGKSWRMQVFNPLASLLGLGDRFLQVLVTVSGEERLRTPYWEGNCLIVESGLTRAWVDSGGVLRQQEFRFPMLGTVRIIREEGFDEAARAKARKSDVLGELGRGS